ncbi:MAG TPA: adenylate/guanylate cyclase domain-containing protein [Acidimicrobiia bacterium]|nr:adenylate/guanylate cyclase domain-containing protein [Acidimicrobiia bacterium]
MSAPAFSPEPDPDRGRDHLLDRLVSTAVLEEDRPEVVRTKKLFTGGVWASLLTSIVSVYQMVVFDAPWAAVTLTIPIIAAVISLTAMARDPRTFPAVMHWIAAGSMLTTMVTIVLFGGVFESANNTIWAVLVVLAAVAIFADRRSHFWLAVFIVGTITAAAVSTVVEPLYEALPNREYLALFNLLVVGTFVYVVLYYFVRQSGRLFRQTETLLHNILPVPIADRLRRSERLIADEYSAASILFADVAGFTPLAAELEPVEVVELLNSVFTAFDDLVAACGLEKIKTIGDAYMVAAGVPVPRDDHATAICELALGMRDRVESGEFAGRHIEMRIGIASGPVMAGIIGRQKFSYDLWGDTVNLASRMETSGEPGRIQITARTHDLVSDRFETEERGLVEVKGRGRVRTWFLLGSTRSVE